MGSAPERGAELSIGGLTAIKMGLTLVWAGLWAWLRRDDVKMEIL